MEESKRLITSWARVKHWLSENFPETLENLYPPAFESHIEAAEATIGLRFPDAVKTLLLEHNGEDHHWPPGIFPDGHRFLPTEDIVETWYKLHEFNDATPENWLPISTSRSKAIRFLDFNPPQGGKAGQVVEVDFNLQTYDVLAGSFVEYIEKYAMDLGVNKYAVIGDDILLNDDVLNNDLLKADSLADDVQDDELPNHLMLNEELLEEDFFDEDLSDFTLPDVDMSENETIVAERLDIAVSHKRDQSVAPKTIKTSDTHREDPKAVDNEVRPAPHGAQTEVPTLNSSVQPVAKKSVRQKTSPPAKTKAKIPAPVKPAANPVRKNAAPQPAKTPQFPQHQSSDRFDSGERLIIIGEMTTLMGKDEMLFTVETEQAKEYTFLAKASFTKGFGDIALDQYVRILAKKFHGEIKSHFIDQGLAGQPEYVAFEYVVLPVEKPSTNKVSLPPPENIDQIAHSILRSIQASVQRGTDYKELKSEQSPYFRSKFYTESTEKLLKLGFHYTADLADQAAVKGVQNTPPYFRVMSFFDDGIVASFHHVKPKLTWPFHAARKVIEFETELSDGNIIISTTAEEGIDYPLPKTINRHEHPASIPLEGLLHKHRSKIRRYQTRNPDAAIVKVRSKREFVALRQRRQQLIYNHLKSIGWVTKEYVAKHFNNKEVAEQVYARIKQFAGTKV